MQGTNYQHTPGPWSYRADGDANHYAIMAGGGWLISFLHNGEALTPTQDANARLIAAAPDLLAALEALEHDWAHGDLAVTRIDYSRQVAHFVAARAAIAKARGHDA